MRIAAKVLAGLLVTSSIAAAYGAAQTATQPSPPPQPPLTEAEFQSAIGDGTINADILTLLPIFNAAKGPDRDRLLAGTRAFALETYGGNGRTCATCHSVTTGVFTLAEARERYAKHPDSALFRAIDSDAGDGKSYARLLRDGTVTVTIPLPSDVRLADDPAATSVTLLRGTPTFMNVAALDPILMHDGRAPDLQAQALDALRVHAQIKRDPTPAELGAIAFAQRGGFTSDEIAAYAQGGPAPGLPAGTTPSEKRGRDFFVSQPVDVKTRHGVCAACHSGPMLDTTNEYLARFFPQVVPLPGTDMKFGAEAGFRMFTNGSAEENAAGLRVRMWRVRGPDGQWEEIRSPDIGLALAPVVVGVPERFKPYLASPALRTNIFKINSLRGISRTPPYFHDNSAKTLEAAVQHYDRFFRAGLGFPGSQAKIELSERDIADISAYLQLL